MLRRARAWWAARDLRFRRELLILAALVFAYGFFRQVPAWNEYSRYDLVRAIVEEQTLQIDSFHENTGDKAFSAGHWYSDKAPGTALLGVPVYVFLSLTSQVTGGGTPDAIEAVQALAFVESGLATAILVLLLIRFLVGLMDERWAITVGLAYGFGSIAFPFATMLFGHATAAAALFGAFYLLHRQKRRPGRWNALAAGFLAGWAVVIEFPVALGVAALLVYALFLGRRVALRFILGGLPLAGILLAHNWLAFGSPLSLGYSNLLPGQFASGMSQGIMGVSWPELDTFLDLMVSPRGLIWLAPWFILVPLGLIALRRRDVRPEVLVCAAIVVLFLLYNAGYYLPFGGWTPGPRFLLPALPFAAVLVAFSPARARIVAIPLMLLSVAIFFVATTTMPNAPERYADPLFQLWLPSFLAGGFAETAAWLRWGLPGFGAITVLFLGLGFGLLALALSFGRRSELATRVMTRTPIALAVLAIAFSVPFPPPGAIGLGGAGPGTPPAVSVVEMGNARMVVDGREEVRLWALIENRGGPIAGGRAQFSASKASGESVWGAYYGDVPIDAGSRQTVTMTWVPDDPEPGPYRFSFSVKDGEGAVVYADVLDLEATLLGR
ncbi:MAG TPA: hypothetical protein VFP56_01495 [Candidatus Limnocylindrales bacterium]|nr:hypothetical protein [Candidatus Limnocylindrales bacterium]